MEERNEESQAPGAAAAPRPLPLPPPGPLPPPATDDGYLELLGVLRVRARGHPAWMLPRYINLGVDVYRFHPQDLLETYPSATAADGSSAVFLINIIHPTTATDHRSRRSVPGGSWTSDRPPVPLVSGSIQGYRQVFSFKVSGPNGKRLRLGYLMQELTLAWDEGAMEGGDQLVLSKVYPTLHGDMSGSGVPSTSNKTRKVGAGSAASSNAASACVSSAPALRLGSSSSVHRAPSPAPPLRLGASTSSEPLLGEVAASTSSAPALGQVPAPTSSAPALGQVPAPTSSAPPLGQVPAPTSFAPALGQVPAPTSSAPPLGQVPAPTSSAPPLGQVPAPTSSAPALGQVPSPTSSSHGTRLVLLEVADFPPVGEDFSPMRIYRASQRVAGRVVLVDCDDLLLLQKKKRQSTDISFTYEQLNAATLGFRRDHLLGEGVLGKVYKGVLNSNKVAIKTLNPHEGQGSREFCTEVMVLSRMNHPNLVKLVGFCADDDQRILVCEFMPLGSLETHIFDLPPDKKPLDWNTRMKILAGAAQGLEHLHANCNPPVINRGVNCRNILLGEGYHPKLSDFCVPSRVVGTSVYCAPEYLESGQLTTKSDVYSFGVVILEVITGRKAYPCSLGQNQMGAELTLVQWAANLIVRNDFGTLVDQTLNNQYSMTELHRVLIIARICLNRTASQRPEMADVAAALSYISPS